MTSTPSWLTQHHANIWLPYTQMQTTPMPLPVVGAQGCKLKLANGQELVDGTSSWWSACHGYNHPHIKEAVAKQLETLPHVMFAGLAHEPAYTLASRLVKMAPQGLTRVFFTDSGSTAVETAMKIAAQYWRNKGEKNRNRFISFKNGYHGDTMGAMSLCDPDKGMHKAFNHYMPMQYTVDIPSDEYSMAEFDSLLNDVKGNIAGLVIEPLVQGAGGFKFHSADILAEIQRLCKKHNILFIADEIMTGFGRTGCMFACQEAGITPDIMTVGKALTGGTMTLAAVLATEHIFEAFLDEKLDKALMNGPTYMANPLACAAANASLDLFEREPRLQQVETIERALYDALEPCKAMHGVVDVRVKGAIGVVQIKSDWDEIFSMRQKAVEYGVWLRPFADVLYIAPPFTIAPEQLKQLTDAVIRLLKDRKK